MLFGNPAHVSYYLQNILTYIYREGASSYVEVRFSSFSLWLVFTVFFTWTTTDIQWKFLASTYSNSWVTYRTSCKWCVEGGSPWTPWLVVLGTISRLLLTPTACLIVVGIFLIEIMYYILFKCTPLKFLFKSITVTWLSFQSGTKQGGS